MMGSVVYDNCMATSWWNGDDDDGDDDGYGGGDEGGSNGDDDYTNNLMIRFQHLTLVFLFLRWNHYL